MAASLEDLKVFSLFPGQGILVSTKKMQLELQLVTGISNSSR